MIIRELLAKLGIELDKSSFTAADVLLQGAKLGLVAIGGAALAATAGLGALVHDLVETASALNDTSQAIGVNVETLQELAYAAKLNGAGLEEVSTALGKLGKLMYAASQGNDEAVKAFSALHVSVRGAGGQLKTADQVFAEIAERFKGMPDGPKKTALAMEAFGRAGAKLIPTLNLGKQGLADAAAEARELAFVIDKETIAAGDDLGDNLDRLSAGAKGLGYAIAGPLLPQVNELVLSFLQWIKANRELIAQRVEKVVKLLTAAGKVLVYVLDKMYRLLGLVIDNWQLLAVVLGSVVLAVVLANIGAITTLVGQYLWFAAVSVAAALRSAAAWVAAHAPVIALAALIAVAILLLDELITYLEGGKTLIGELWPAWKKFLDEWLNSASDDDPWWIAIMKGWVALALHFPEIWDQVIADLKTAFTAFGEWCTDAFDKIVEAVIGRVTGAFDRVRALLHIGGGDPAPVGPPLLSAPTLSPSGQVGSRYVSSRTTNDIKVYALPGQSPTDVAGAVRREIDAHRQTELEETAQAFGGGD